MKKRGFLLAVFLSFIAQMFISLLETYGDVHSFFIPWAKSIEELGTSGFYDRIINHSAPNYPPVAISIITVFYAMGKLFIPNYLSLLWQINLRMDIFPSQIFSFFNRDNVLIYAFVKLPGIISNIALAVIVYFFLKNTITKKTKPRPSFFIYSLLFNPALIFLSALWGQIDIIPFIFVILSFCFLEKNRAVLSMILITISLLIKQTSILVVPFYLIYLVKKVPIKKIVPGMLFSYMVLVASFWPFETETIKKFFPIDRFFRIQLAFGSDYVSMHAHNFWQMVMPGAKDMAVRHVSLIFVGMFLCYLLFLIAKKGATIKTVIVSFAVFSIFSFMFLTRMHERHLTAAIPFLFLASAFEKRFYPIFVFESLYLLTNMYAAWPIPRIDFLYSALNNQTVVSILVLLQLTVVYKSILLAKDFINAKK